MRHDASLAPVTLSPATAAFLQGGVSIRMASCGVGGRPVTARALAAALDAGRRHLTLYIDRRAALPFLEAVEAGGRVAAAFTQPTTHRCIQVKGTDAAVHPPEAGALDIIDRHHRLFAVELREVGFAEGMIAAHDAYDPDGVVAVTFACLEVFDQTPGPRAGDAMTP
ncbi:hypothetical protein ACM64Y_13860 [Novispirillum sp. DQ9]|uniref:hypothetical protein n=1 Tax=Novispirillum sp. DQ9 TaxID=3398612 RepID=UPI003C7E318C